MSALTQSGSIEKPCTILINYDKGDPPQVNEFKQNFEHGTTEQKIETLKKVILYTINGEPIPQLLMPIILYVMPSNDHTIKKLLLIYWEVIEKTHLGKLKSEMILVCNSLLNDLNHPNEFVRGSTLRFLCKLREAEVLEPLVPSVRSNLENRHAYCRRNAVLAIYNIYSHFDYLIPDAPELIYNFLLQEKDASCKRNAFIMLFNCAPEKAVEYLSSVLDEVPSFGDMLQFIVVELIRKVCKTSPSERSKYIKCIFTLLNSSSPAVKYESAGTLLSLSSAPTAVRGAASAYIDLLCNESDNNVKMIVLDKLIEIKKNHSKIMEELVMDILRALSSPNIDICKKVLNIVLDSVTPKNIDEIILFLKKEINKTQSKEFDKGLEYRHILIRTIHVSSLKYPEVLGNVVPLLMEYLGDSYLPSAVDVVIFLREVVETYPSLRELIIKKLIENLSSIKVSKVYRVAVWVIAEYVTCLEDLQYAMTSITNDLEELLKPKQTEEVILETKAKVKIEKVSIQKLIADGDWYLASCISSSLTKLFFRAEQLNIDNADSNKLKAQVMMIISVLINLSKASQVSTSKSAYERMLSCIQVLIDSNATIKKIWLQDCRDSFANYLKYLLIKQSENKKKTEKEVLVKPNNIINIRQLKSKKAFGPVDTEDDLIKAVGNTGEANKDQNEYSKISQLSGFSDPIYVEAYVRVHQYDIVLDISVFNQTNDTLQNVTLELVTLGDLKICERVPPFTMAPREKTSAKASIKVSSTDNGVIMGTIAFDIAGSVSSMSDKNCVILNELHIDVIDYILPANHQYTDVLFRNHWLEFEWENKIPVNTNITDLVKYVHHISKVTNMGILTPEVHLSNDTGILSANLCAKSVFGEDALANICIEKQADGKISGYIRIRAKVQSIAVTLGEKIGNMGMKA
ncbi:coatomer protein complex beta subunit [Dictyostelium discoideum AX4]|uniref:Coatomer subunit beta n=1 Tax=Dictyostelium discoideum TaxID=44689 RepID=COPB_DICDI|nr:coatomer protein complex beta subunit [Dictyostelium discoideum AX4]Q23924.2 RecName: Full=Coatomer subunit beta; AltName: Full=Beta-coat protein; Short=Beta-COP [Dictyostelium discoideum]AAF62179.1 beta-COP protein [Dictyostelium discoideum]EAL65020.1 coatomer protein complex beta subunit [Dictyostelium discoideum AX4]|eukprot:XP_638375.1 coatomer protein complex beta subunit [Dictyostelium discoideum AX4]